MLITKASLADVNEINQLVNSAYRGEESKKGWTTEADILDGIRIDEAALKAYFDKENVTLLKYTDDAGELIGCVYLELKKPKLYLGMFSVKPHLQGKGIGKTLMLAAEEFALANACHTITISVISSRSELIAWYERLGYRPTGESIAFDDIDGRFGDPKVDGIALITMEKIIPNV